MEDAPSILPPPTTLEPISRPSSTTSSASQTQLPGISSIAAAAAAATAAVASATSSPQLRAATNAPAPMPVSMPLPAPPPPATMYPTTSPAATSAGSAGNLPVCQNCSTSTTPLWRRDELGAVLCNACGLFLKLHGRPRPISLKTDVIKSRNRVKTMRPDVAMKKKQQQQAAAQAAANGASLQAQDAAAAALGVRRTSGKANGRMDDTDSPISRTATPNMYTGGMPVYPGVDEHHLQQPLSAYVNAHSPGRAPSPLTADRLDAPQTTEQLLALNSSLRTRVDELEVINDLIQRRLHHYETYGTGAGTGAGVVEGAEAAQNEAQLRAQLEAVTASEAQLRAQLESLTQSEAQLRSQLEESHRRENNLKRSLVEMEAELKDTKEALEAHENGRAKKLRVSDMVSESEMSTPQSQPNNP